MSKHYTVTLTYHTNHAYDYTLNCMPKAHNNTCTN